MVDGIGDSLLQFGVPFGHRLVRAGIDEIEGHTRKNLPRQPNGFQGIGDIMQAAEEFQVAVIQCLHAERDTIDACRPITPKPFCLDAGRISLHGDLDTIRHMPETRDAIQ